MSIYLCLRCLGCRLKTLAVKTTTSLLVPTACNACLAFLATLSPVGKHILFDSAF
jgi:hypothetical protein